MIDRKYINQTQGVVVVDRQIAAETEEIADGAFLVSVIEGGVEKVKVVASPAGTEKIAGIAMLPYFNPEVAVSNEQFKVPSSGSLIMNLRNQKGVASTARAAVVGGSDLTVDPTNFSATPSTGTVKWDAAGGRLKFAAGDAGKVVNFIYKYELTLVQAQMRFGERSLNNRTNTLGLATVYKGYVEIGTDQYDTAIDWSNLGSDIIILGPNGIITADSSGAAIPGAKVIAAPDLSGTAQGAFLRISCLIP